MNSLLENFSFKFVGFIHRTCCYPLLIPQKNRKKKIKKIQEESLRRLLKLVIKNQDNK